MADGSLAEEDASLNILLLLDAACLPPLHDDGGDIGARARHRERVRSTRQG